LIQQVFFPDGFEQPPHGFDVLVPVGNVSAVKVHPITNAFCQAFPILNAFESRFAAKRVEFFDAVGLDLRLVGETEFLFDLDFHRQPMRIPAAAAVNVKTVHRLIARKHILENAREDVVNTRLAVSRGRTLEKDIGRAIFTLIGRLFEHLVHLPKAQNAVFQDFHIQFWRNSVKHTPPKKNPSQIRDELKLAVPPWFPGNPGQLSSFAHTGKRSRH